MLDRKCRKDSITIFPFVKLPPPEAIQRADSKALIEMLKSFHDS